MAIEKSSRHSKIVGQFGESLVANLLSRSGFEVIFADHVGFDLIAFRTDVGRLGISVKSRTRGTQSSEQVSVNLFDVADVKLEKSCYDFGLIPWIAVYVETESSGDLYLTSLANYKGGHSGGKKMLVWNMKQQHQDAYAQDQGVMHFQTTFAENNWFGKTMNRSLPEVTTDV